MVIEGSSNEDFENELRLPSKSTDYSHAKRTHAFHNVDVFSLQFAEVCACTRNLELK